MQMVIEVSVAMHANDRCTRLTRSSLVNTNREYRYLTGQIRCNWKHPFVPRIRLRRSSANQIGFFQTGNIIFHLNHGVFRVSCEWVPTLSVAKSQLSETRHNERLYIQNCKCFRRFEMDSAVASCEIRVEKDELHTQTVCCHVFTREPLVIFISLHFLC